MQEANVKLKSFCPHPHPMFIVVPKHKFITHSISWRPVSSCLTGEKRFQHSTMKPYFTFRKAQVGMSIPPPSLSMRPWPITTRPHSDQALPETRASGSCALAGVILLPDPPWVHKARCTLELVYLCWGNSPSWRPDIFLVMQMGNKRRHIQVRA